MTEFDVQMGLWKFGKKGVLGDPKDSAIAIGAKKYPKGLGMHPTLNRTVRVRYALGKQAAKFVAAVALNEYPTPAPGKVTFEVLGDNKVLWTSKPIQARGDVQECKVNVSTVSILELRVTVSGTEWNAHAVWLDPRVLKN
jgi:NPCBM/NEW2 domain